MIGFKEFLFEMLDKPYELEDVTHKFDPEHFKELNFHRSKVHKAKDTDDHFMVGHRDGAWEVHHFKHDYNVGIGDTKLNSDKPPAKFVSTINHLAKAKIDNREQVRVVATPNHHDAYRRIAERLAKKHGFKVTKSEDSPYDHGFGPMKQFYIRPYPGKLVEALLENYKH